MRCMFILEKVPQIMSEHEIRVCSLCDGLHHLMRLEPRVIVSSQPAMRNGLFVILADMVLVGSK